MDGIPDMDTSIEAAIIQEPPLPPAIPTRALDTEGAPEPPPAAYKARLCLQTPMRLKHDGRLIKLVQSILNLLLSALRVRLRDLHELYGLQDHDSELPGVPAILNSSLLGRNLRWRIWTRYTNRQHTATKLGGIVDEIELDLGRMRDRWPLLRIGQRFHLGKQASMGPG